MIEVSCQPDGARMASVASDVIWKSSKEMGWTAETFQFFMKRWDVDKAKAILRTKPRDPAIAKVKDLEPILSKTTDLGNGKHSITIGIHVDWEAAKNGKTKLGNKIDLSVPLIAITHENGKGTIIDGHHRIARAVTLDVKELLVMVLTTEETKGIEL